MTGLIERHLNRLETRITPRVILVVLFCFSLIAAGYTLISTQGGGIGTSPDAINFIAASKTLLAGEGYWRFTRIPFTSWPPLYPTLLAGLNIVGRLINLDITEMIRFTNTIVMMIIVWMAGLLFLRYVRSRLLALMGTCFAVFSIPVIRMSLYAWTELFYILLTLIFVWLLPTFLEEKKPRQLIVLLLVATLGSLQRFAGIGMVAGGAACILLFTREPSLRKRIIYSVLMLLCALPWILWLAYGLSLPRRAVIPQTQPFQSLLHNLELTPVLLGQWFFSYDILHPILSFIGLLIVGTALVYAVWCYYRRSPDSTGQLTSPCSSPAFISVYVLVYMASFYSGHLFVTTTAIDQRHMSVNLIIIYLLIFWGLDRLAEHLKASGRKFLLIGAVTVYLLYPAWLISRDISDLSRGFGIANWHRQDPLMHWLITHPLGGRQYSNTPLPLFYTPALVLSAPVEPEDWPNIVNAYPNEDIYLIWFNDADIYIGMKGFYYNFPYTVEELMNIAEVEKVVEVETGKVFRIQSRN